MDHDSFSFHQPIKIDHAMIFLSIYRHFVFHYFHVSLPPINFFVKITSILCVLKAYKFSHLVVDHGVYFLFYLYLIVYC